LLTLGLLRRRRRQPSIRHGTTSSTRRRRRTSRNIITIITFTCRHNSGHYLRHHHDHCRLSRRCHANNINTWRLSSAALPLAAAAFLTHRYAAASHAATIEYRGQLTTIRHAAAVAGFTPRHACQYCCCYRSSATLRHWLPPPPSLHRGIRSTPSFAVTRHATPLPPAVAAGLRQYHFTAPPRHRRHGCLLPILDRHQHYHRPTDHAG